MVPLRVEPEELPATLYVTVPFPTPLLPPVTVSHEVSLLVAVHEQLLVFVTVKPPEPP
jgi:hypothetical protein